MGFKALDLEFSGGLLLGLTILGLLRILLMGLKLNPSWECDWRFGDFP